MAKGTWLLSTVFLVLLSGTFILSRATAGGDASDVVRMMKAADDALVDVQGQFEVVVSSPFASGTAEIEGWWKRPQSLRLEVKSSTIPDLQGRILASDGKTLWDHKGAIGTTAVASLADRATINTLALSELAALIDILGSGTTKVLESSDVRLIGLETQLSTEMYRLDVALKNDGDLKASLSNAVSVSLWVEKERALPRVLEVAVGPAAQLKVTTKSLVHNQGISDSVFRLDGKESIAALSLPPGGSGISLEEDSILLKAAQFDPIVERFSKDNRSVAAAEVLAGPYHIVQFKGPVLEAQKKAVREAGGLLLDYIPNNAYLARLDGASKEAVQAMRFVRWVGPFETSFRLDPLLLERKGAVTVTVQTLRSDDVDAVGAATGSLGGNVHEVNRSAWGGSLRAVVDGESLNAIASLSGVKWVEEYVPPRLMNDVGRSIMGVPTVWNTGGLTGTGQIVAVADTGLDTGNLNTISRDFTGRVLNTISYRNDGTWYDEHGHGTHVAGSVLGSGALSGGRFAGVAPGAKLVFQSFGHAGGFLTGIPPDLNKLFLDSYQKGARIHSNSWGGVGNSYLATSREIDQFIWEHKDMTILFAAGNAGVDKGADGTIDPGSLGPEANAKNAIVVGGSESNRPSEGRTGTWGDIDQDRGTNNWPAEPIKGDLISDKPEGMAAFSSRGPAGDGRIKPDVVAPGVNILSARTHAPSAKAPNNQYDNNYAYDSGTSMATPLTAGAAALVRQYYMGNKSLSSPSAALVKATLLNGAREITPGQYGTGPLLPPVFSDNLEGSVADWRADKPWTLSDTSFASATHSWWYTGTVGASLVLYRAFDLTKVSNPTLYFWQRYNLSSGQRPPSTCGLFNTALFWVQSKVQGSTDDFKEYAKALVEVSTDGGKTWSTLAEYTDRVPWARSGVDLSRYSSRTNVMVRFRIKTIDPSRHGEWFVDDLQLSQKSVQEVPTRPNWVEGWGRVNLADSLFPAAPTKMDFLDNTSGLTTGQGLTYTVQLASAAVPVRVTLAWTDYPAGIFAAKQLVNDLDLRVVAPDGRVYYPNGNAGADRLNNVETVDIASPAPGQYRIEAKGTNVPEGPQPFALVVSGALSSTDFPPLPTPIPTATSTPTATPTRTPTPTPDPLQLAERWSYRASSLSNYVYVYHEVRNNSSKKMANVKTVFKAYDSSNSLVATDTAYAMLDVVRPGQWAPVEFLLYFPGGLSAFESSRKVFEIGDGWYYTSSDPQADLQVLSDSTYVDSLGWRHVIGELKNVSSVTVEFPKVVIVLRGKDGRILEADRSYGQRTSLAPGSSTTFDALFTRSYGQDYGGYEVIPQRLVLPVREPTPTPTPTATATATPTATPTPLPLLTPLPDLFIDSADIWTDPVTIRDGTLAAVGATIRNSTSASAGKVGTPIVVYFYDGNPSQGGILIGSGSVPLVTSFGSASLWTNFIWDTTGKQGGHDLYVVVDPQGSISEADEANNMARRSILVLQSSSDTVPPSGRVVVNGGGGSTSSREVTLGLDAQDNDGGSGVKYVYVSEVVLNQTSRQWVAVQDSGWKTYATSLAWTLTSGEGAKYLRVWFADGAENISDAPATAMVNLTTPTSTVTAGERVLYRQAFSGGTQVTITLTTNGGDVDLFVWAPGNSGSPNYYSVNSGTTQDTVSFTSSVSGVYQVEVHGYENSSYTLSIATSPSSGPTELSQEPSQEARTIVGGKTIPSAPLNIAEPSNQAGVPAVQSAPAGTKVYLPALMRNKSGAW